VTLDISFSVPVDFGFLCKASLKMLDEVQSWMVCIMGQAGRFMFWALIMKLKRIPREDRFEDIHDADARFTSEFIHPAE
jgi:hypothetical protein